MGRASRANVELNEGAHLRWEHGVWPGPAIEGTPALSGSARQLPGALVQSLALSSTEAMIRNRTTPTDFILRVDASPITQLRACAS